MTNSNRPIKNYRIILSFLIPFFFSTTYLSQTLKVNIGVGYQFHIEGTRAHGYYIPFLDRSTVPTNSINEFFKNSFNYSIGLNYWFDPQENKLITLGLDYERSVLESRYDEVNLVLGEDLYVNTFTPNIGFNKYLTLDEKTILNSNIGLTLMYCHGYSEIEGLEFSHNYNTSLFLRLGLSLIFDELFTPNFGLVVGIKGFIGFVSRDNVHVKYNKESTTLEPIGSRELQDNTFNPFVNLQYKFGL